MLDIEITAKADALACAIGELISGSTATNNDVLFVLCNAIRSLLQGEAAEVRTYALLQAVVFLERHIVPDCIEDYQGKKSRVTATLKMS